MELPIFFSTMRIFRLPVIHLSSFFLLLDIPLIHYWYFCNIWYGDFRLSPVDTMSLFNMADLRPHGAVYILTKTTYTHFAFRYEQNVGAPICYISGLKCLMPLLPCCLRLAHTVTSAHPKLATGGLVNPFQTGFPPVKHCTLLGAHSIIVAILPELRNC